MNTPSQAPILLLNDQPEFAQMIKEALHSYSLEADLHTSANEALKAVVTGSYRVVVADLLKDEMSGARWAKEARVLQSDLPIILITEEASNEPIHSAGDVHCIFKNPLDIAKLIEQIKQCLDLSPTARGGTTLAPFAQSIKEDATELTYPKPLKHLAGCSPVSEVFLQRIWQLMQFEQPIWIVGPSGVEIEQILLELGEWKRTTREPLFLQAEDFCCERALKALHSNSFENKEPRVVLWGNLTGLSLLAQDDFLIWIQAAQKTCRHLLFIVWVEAHLFHHNPPVLSPAIISQAQSRALYYPPLRRRLADLAHYWTSQSSEKFPLSAALTSALMHHDWPGNYRELRDLIHFVKTNQSLPASWEQRLKNAPPVSLETDLLTEQNALINSAFEKIKERDDPKKALSDLLHLSEDTLQWEKSAPVLPKRMLF
jgi:DNA-binding NtrC family response regulator